MGLCAFRRGEGVKAMDDLKLCESDYRFLCVVWEHMPVSSGDLVKLCADKLGWKKSTTYTVLRKLCQRGFLKNENTVVTALVPKEEVQLYHSGHFVDRMFEGSLPQFLVSFLGSRPISPKEAREIRDIIDQYADKDGKGGQT